jgi:serine/threonine protein phosphatase PrpC
MKYITATKSITGLRENNQDNCLSLSYRNVNTLLVCDGNGGTGGEKISQSAVKAIIGEIFYHLYREKRITLRLICKIGFAAIANAARQIELLKKDQPQLEPCGTTATLIFSMGSTVVALWVGDSPGLICKDGQLIRLTDPPHTLSELLIKQGSSRESIEKQVGLSSILTCCLGHSDSKPDYKVIKFRPQSQFIVLAASDGINTLPQDKLLEIITSTRLTKNLPAKIVGASLAYGSDDNITVAATKVSGNKRLIRRKLKYV